MSIKQLVILYSLLTVALIAASVFSVYIELLNSGYIAGKACTYEIRPEYIATDPESLYHLQTAEDTQRVRSKIITSIWPEGMLPERGRVHITTNIKTPPYVSIRTLPNLARTDQIDVVMDYGFTSTAYLLHPKNSNNKLVIFHQGHKDTLQSGGGYNIMARLLDKGYTIAGFYMPLFGPNTGPIERSSSTSHNSMAALEPYIANPLKYFLEPAAVVLNYIDEHHDYDDVIMIGTSGGGWVATFYAAIDPRITTSISIAGSLPRYLRNPLCKGETGDYEQGVNTTALVDNFYTNTASYLDLYVLAAHGGNRKHVHVFNKNDWCCFGGMRHKLFESSVQQKVHTLGSGEYKVILDTSHRGHSISQWALEQIIKEVR